MEAHSKSRLPAWAVYLIFGFLCLAVLFVLRIVRPPTLHTTFSLSFPDLYRSAPTVEIGGFNQAERWQGVYTLDSERSIDGETGMNIFSMNGTPVKVMLQKNINLKGYDSIYAYFFVSNKENLDGINSVTVNLTDGKGTSSYNLTGLKVGWNYKAIRLDNFVPQPDPAGISSVAIVLTSKKGVTAQLTLDRLWAQRPLKTDAFAKADTGYTNLETVNKKTFLHLSSPAPVTTLFKKETAVSRFSYTVGLSPLKLGSFGLTFLNDPKSGDGYYFLISGRQMNEWHLLKKEAGRETEMERGTLASDTFVNGAMVWLRAEKDGDNLTLSYTINGQQYVQITKYRDTTFDNGNFGIVSTGSYLIDSVDVKE